MTTIDQLNGTYVIDPTHSQIGFVARHAMVTKVRGSFTEYSGQAVTGPDLADAKIDVTVQMASVDTRSADRDGHLRTGDFFSVEEFPEMTFTSTSVEKAGEDALRVTGDLTIKGTTRPITLDLDFQGAATDPYGNERIGFEGSTTINRKDYGVNFHAALESGGVLVSDKIQLELEISAIKQA